MKFRNHTLKNGLEIVAECNEGAHSLSTGFFVKTGARDELAEVAGVSHFLEHMAFKGTANRTAEGVNLEFDEIGAHYNAFTSDEMTVYYASILPEFQDRAVKLLADIMRPALRQDDFDMEKKVIIEEIQMYLDQPPFGADDILKEHFFGNHALANSVLGTEKSVGGLTSEQMRSYFQERYAPGNMFVAASGKVDFESLVASIEEACEEWPTVLTSRKVEIPKPKAGNYCVYQESSTQQYIMQAANAPAAEDEDRFAAKLLSTIIGDDSGSRMYWELVDPGIAETASLGHYEYQGAGLFYAWTSCAPEETEDILDRLASIYKIADQTGVTQEEVALAKSKVISRIVLSSEKSRNRLFALGGNWAQRGEYRSVADDMESIQNVTLNEVQAVLEKYPLTQNATLTVGPRNDLKGF